MKKQYDIPANKRVFLLNTGEVVEGADSCLGIRVDEGLILTFEETTGIGDKNMVYLHLLRELPDGKYEYYAADMDFKLHKETGAISQRTLYGTAETGRLPVFDFDRGVGEIRVTFNPKKLTIQDVLARDHQYGWMLEFWRDEFDYRGDIETTEYKGGKLTFTFSTTDKRVHAWVGDKENIGDWTNVDEGIKEFTCEPTHIHEISENEVKFGLSASNPVWAKIIFITE